MDRRDEMTLPSNRGEIGGSNLHGCGGGSQEGGLHAPPVSNPNIAEVMEKTKKKKKKRGRPRKYGPPPPFPGDGAEKPRRGRPPGTGWRQKLAALQPNMSGEKQGEYPTGPSSQPCAPMPPPVPQPPADEEDDDDIKIYVPLPKNRTATLGEDENMIDAIKAKHGNIDEDCIMKSESVRKMSLVLICNVLKDLEKKSLEEFEVASLENYYEVVRDVEKLNINVKWLLERLDEIKDAITSRDEAKGWMKKLEGKRREVERLANENRIFEAHKEWLKRCISNARSKLQIFQNMPDIMDGLI